MSFPEHFPRDLYANICGFCEPRDVIALSLVDKNHAGIVFEVKELWSRSFCHAFSQTALPLNNSWQKRWRVMSDFTAEACNQYSIDLSFFFDQKLTLLPNSPSFFQDEVLLVNADASQLYCCNYLTNKMRRLECQIDEKIHQIYCSGHLLAIASNTNLVIYDLKDNEVLSRYTGFSVPGLIEFFDGRRLVYFVDLSKQYYLFKNFEEAPDILDEYLVGSTYQNKIYFDGRHFVRLGALQEDNSGVEVYDCLNKTLTYSVPQKHLIHAGVKCVINSNLVAYTTFNALVDVRAGTVFNLSFIPSNEPNSYLNTIASLILKEDYVTTALYATRNHFIVGLTDSNNQNFLAFWDYKNQVVFIKSAAKINFLIVHKGTILTSDNGTNFTLFDFTGKKPSHPKIESRFNKEVRSNTLMHKIFNVIKNLFLVHFYTFRRDIQLYYIQNNYTNIVIWTVSEVTLIGVIALAFYKTIKLLRKV